MPDRSITLSKQQLGWGVAALLAVALVVLAGEEIATHLKAIDAALAQNGAAGIALVALLYIVASSVLIPESLLAFLAGAALGLWWGLLATAIGGLLAAMLQYAIAHRWLREPILHFADSRPTWRAVHAALLQDEKSLQWLLRLAPFNPALISYLLGALGVRFGRYVLACSALMLHVSVEVYAGHATRHFVHSRHAAEPSGMLHDVLLVGGLLIVALILHRVATTARRAIAEAARTADAPAAASSD